LKRLGFLASGRGSNMLAIIRACESGRLPASPVLVISNNPDARALQLGSEHGLEALHMSRRTHGDAAALDQAMTAAMQAHQVDLVILAGYMKKIGPQLLSAYAHRILNIHPSLLPKHGGRGMYGMHVHEAVIAAGETETGVTVHLVNAEYDSLMRELLNKAQILFRKTSIVLAVQYLHRPKQVPSAHRKRNTNQIARMKFSLLIYIGKETRVLGHIIDKHGFLMRDDPTDNAGL